ncbi:dph5 [Ecytonucleospora hepatopenaei]|uniref:diphthine methyl ester synthase n=1 Tax=Ecytonucleospora hepatopenaei TaxID=646526 RepID=A0A1W0E2C7_9MICR|nr:dph5 [Ecytonucleospora hepatopenaei]
MLYIIGTGLNDYKDISLRTLEVLLTCDEIYYECYTCIQNKEFNEIEKYINNILNNNTSNNTNKCNFKLANRQLVEDECEIVQIAKNKRVAFLVAGTPFFATTHVDLLLRAKEEGVEYKVIHNVSISNVMGCYGLYSYNFGRTVSICLYENENINEYIENNICNSNLNNNINNNIYNNNINNNIYNSNLNNSNITNNICNSNLNINTDNLPLSFYDNIYNNYINNLHTLCLLDIKTDREYFMDANRAIAQILLAEEVRQYGMVDYDTKLLVVCRFATDTERTYYDSVRNLLRKEYGKPLHSLIILGKGTSVIEKEFIEKIFE